MPAPQSDIFLLNSLPQMLDFVKEVCNNGIVATATESEASPATLPGTRLALAPINESKETNLLWLTKTALNLGQWFA